ncbi:uncharacterized protein LOC8028903 [Ixodes scapularis]|uniref:uncharacterized protein LOC8028903 n=1 Tax=Ixodes scapularis TaxID=6945 RepID=UPI001C3848F4|nr:uncharacterized protein LOC8028903 [Ixodes scapularis]
MALPPMEDVAINRNPQCRTSSGTPQQKVASQPPETQRHKAQSLAAATKDWKWLGMFTPPDRIRNRIPGLLTRALPIYLIPFLLGGNATRSLYCILVTVASMASDDIPVPVTAFVPIVLVQLTGLMEPEKLGSAFMNRLRVSLGPGFEVATFSPARDGDTFAQPTCESREWGSPPFLDIGPLLVKQYKGPHRAVRKASFDPVPLRSVPQLPIRRIQSFSGRGNVKRCSILKDTRTGETGASPDLSPTKPDSSGGDKSRSPEVPFARRAWILKPTGSAPRSSPSFKPNTVGSPATAQSVPTSPSGPTSERKMSILKEPTTRRPSILKPPSDFRAKRTSLARCDDDPAPLDKRLAELGDIAGTRRFKPLQMVQGMANRMFVESPRNAEGAPHVILSKQETLSFESQQISSPETLKLQTVCVSLRTALLLGATMTAIFGNLASFWNVPARKAILHHLSKYQLVSAWSWFIVTVPVATVCSLVSFGLIYAIYLVPIEEFDESLQEDINKCAVARLKELRGYRFEEALVAYWFLLFPFYYVSNISKTYDAEQLEAPLLGLSAIAMSMLPRRSRWFWARHRLAPWEVIKSRMPWSVIVMYGSVSTLALLAEEHNVVKYIFDRVGRKFWQYKSVQTNQLLLCLLAAFLSEFVGNTTLNNLMMPIVINIVRETT